MKRFFTLCLPLALCMTVSCKKESDVKVETQPLSGFKVSSVTCNGKASGKKILEKGICWNTLGEPSVNNNIIKSEETGEGEFHLDLIGLTSNQVYYVRAYCKTKTEIVYGSTKTYTTLEQPIAVSNNATAFTHNSFTTSGSFESRGNSFVEAGICWSSAPEPTIVNSKITGTVSVNSFTCTINGLDSNKIYFYRAYATFVTGTVYGVQKSIKTYSGRMKDIEGNVYYTVKIGNTTWMASNLKTTRFRDGSTIPYYLTNSWTTVPAYGSAYGKYNNVNSSVPVGFLYNAFAVQDPKGLAPAGWHVATLSDWQSLENTLGANPGNQLKTDGNLYWNNNSTSTNSSGFSAIASGSRSSLGGDSGNKDRAYFWTSSVSSTNGTTLNVHSRALYSNNALLMSEIADGKNGYSVRCVKD